MPLKSYHILLKKSIAVFVTVIFLLLPSQIMARVPNDPEYSLQAAMWNQLRAPEAWNMATGSREVVVAIIDTGADTWHDDLRENIWTNRGEIEDNGVDDDRNGYVDDIHGWNFVENNNDVRTSVFTTSTDDPEAIQHGTIVAGLIGARGDNGDSGTGINWNVRLMPLRAIASDGGGSFEQVARAVDYAASNGARVISMSFVGDLPGERLRVAVRRAYERGVVIVAAAGNEGHLGLGNLDELPRYPICYDRGESDNWVLGVASVNARDKISRFSHYGSCVDLAAPGEQIFSTERYSPQYGFPRKFGGGWNGTSFAAPLVAGAAALLASVRPDWRAPEIIQTLLDNADTIEETSGNSVPYLGRGRLNIARAVAYAAQNAPTLRPFTALYYERGNQIWRYDLQSSSRAAAAVVSGAALVDFAVSDLNGDAEPDVLALTRRGKFYFARLYFGGRRGASEFFLEGTSSKGNYTAQNIHSLVREEGNRLVVRYFSASRNATVFAEYDMAGRLLRTANWRGGAAAWVLNREGELIVASLRGGRMRVAELRWDGDVVRELSIPGVTRVYGLESAPIWSSDDEQVIALFVKRGRVSQAVIDLPTKSFREESYGKAAGSALWKIGVGRMWRAERAPIVRYSSGGGSVSVVGDYGESYQQFELPSIQSKKFALW